MQTFQEGEPIKVKETSSLNPNAIGRIVALVANEASVYFVHIKNRGLVKMNSNQLSSERAEF